MKLGSTFSMTYDLVSQAPQSVAVGAALYDTSGADQADGTGDQDSINLTAGHTSYTRQVLIPASLTPGGFFVYGEIWPVKKIGLGEPLVVATCGHIKVVS